MEQGRGETADTYVKKILEPDMEETDTEQPLRNDNQEDTDDWQSATDNPVDTQVESETWSSKATKPWGAMWTCAPRPTFLK
jgi:hypothetical protein